MRFISLLGVLVVTAVNVVVLAFASALAVGGDGDAHGIYVVLVVGGVSIAAFTGLALYCWKTKRPAIVVAACALPFAFAAGLVFVVAAQFLGFKVG